MGKAKWWVCDQCKSLNDVPAKKCYNCRTKKPAQPTLMDDRLGSVDSRVRASVTVDRAMVAKLVAPDPMERAELSRFGDVLVKKDTTPASESTGEASLLRVPPQRGIAALGGRSWVQVDQRKDAAATAAAGKAPEPVVADRSAGAPQAPGDPRLEDARPGDPPPHQSPSQGQAPPPSGALPPPPPGYVPRPGQIPPPPGYPPPGYPPSPSSPPPLAGPRPPLPPPPPGYVPRPGQAPPPPGYPAAPPPGPQRSAAAARLPAAPPGPPMSRAQDAALAAAFDAPPPDAPTPDLQHDELPRPAPEPGDESDPSGSAAAESAPPGERAD